MSARGGRESPASGCWIGLLVCGISRALQNRTRPTGFDLEGREQEMFGRPKKAIEEHVEAVMRA